MPRQYFSTTAEYTLRVAEAIHVIPGNPKATLIQEFCRLPLDQTHEALGLAEDIGLIRFVGGEYSTASPLTRYLATPINEIKISLLRITLESYPIYVTFRERLFESDDALTSAHETMTLHELAGDPEDIKSTLISLGTYSNDIISKAGGKLERSNLDSSLDISNVLVGCADKAVAESWVRNRLGSAAANADREEVILPLAEAIIYATASKSDVAVTMAGNAFESYIKQLADRMGVSLIGATGINGFLGKFSDGARLPTKVRDTAKYIGHVRNAADHGIDSEISASWIIQESTGIEIVHVICSMIRACHEREKGGDPIL